MKTKTSFWLAFIVTIIAGLLVCLSFYIIIALGFHYHPEPIAQAAPKFSVIPISILPVILLLAGLRLSVKALRYVLIPVILFGVVFTVIGATLLATDPGDTILYFPSLVYGIFMMISAYLLRELKLEIVKGSL